jgi:hypothetical protein
MDKKPFEDFSLVINFKHFQTASKYSRMNTFFMIAKVLIISMIVSSCTSGQKPLPAAAPAPTVSAPAPLHLPKDSICTIYIPGDTIQNYSFYYPTSAKDAGNTLVLICFDPHADGALPIHKYKKWADKYGIAIAGSNTSQNGLNPPAYQSITTNLINDINIRLGFEKKNMALCGFSGGAKVAISTLITNTEIQNVIYSGAAMTIISASSMNVLGFAGDQDMNYSDLLQYSESIKPTYPRSSLIEFKGKHEWPDSLIFENAFYWLKFNQFRQAPGMKDSTVINSFVQKTDRAIAEAKKRGNWLAAYQQCHHAALYLDGLHDVTSYKNQIASIAADPSYIKALAKKNEILASETKQKQELLEGFQNQTITWWAHTIERLQKSDTPSDKRLLGFISLGCYTYSSQLLQEQKPAELDRMLDIYEMCDPKNTDQLYLHAVYFTQTNNYSRAIEYLTRAVQNGYTDVRRMEAEPAFNQLKYDPDYIRLVASLKKAPK